MLSYNHELLTIEEVAEWCRVSRRTVFRWFAQGKLRAVRIGGIVRVRRSDLDLLFKPPLDATTGVSAEATGGVR